MRSSETDIIIVPGLNGSGLDHWQTRWRQKLATARAVEQADWDNPVLTDWTQNLVDAVNAATKPVVIVAHSLGVLTVVHAAPMFTPGKVAGAFLVAPPSKDSILSIAEIDDAFAHAPRDPLPFPSVLVASRNDEYGHYHEAEDHAYAWGSRIVDAGDSGHINSASGHGPWPEGLMTFAGFLSKL